MTAFLYNGLAARPYWNSSILAPQFLASAFCSGPAILLVVLQVLRKFTSFEIQDEAIHKIAELMAYAMFLNLFLHGAEAFKEYYSDTEHLLFTRYWYQGLGAHRTLVPYAWTAVTLNVVAFALFITPRMRRNWVTLNIGCLAVYAGCYIEKGMGLIIPGLTPDALGEIYQYYPSLTELRVAAGVFALGFLLFTLMLKVAVPISLGEFQRATAVGGNPEGSPYARSCTAATDHQIAQGFSPALHHRTTRAALTSITGMTFRIGLLATFCFSSRPSGPASAQAAQPAARAAGAQWLPSSGSSRCRATRAAARRS